MNIINNENRADAGAGVHAVIQHTGEVYVGLPIDPEKKTAVRNWHGGSGPKGSCNNTHIGVEMTEPATIKYTGGASWIELSDGSNTKAVVLKNYRNAVEYFAYLCQKFGWNPEKDGVILSHSEGHDRGYATNHADVEHIWKKYGLTMDQFRKDVKAAMGRRRHFGFRIAHSDRHGSAGREGAFRYSNGNLHRIRRPERENNAFVHFRKREEGCKKRRSLHSYRNFQR